MRRVDLVELEDRPRFPEWLRDPMTGYLKVVVDAFGPYDVCAPAIAAALRATGLRTIVDLAGGAGGPWPRLRDAIAREGVEVDVVVTDLHPNLRAAERFEAVDGVTYRRTPVSALDVPADLPGLRTVFTALHHFDPDRVRTLMKAAQDADVPFLAAEATHRSIRGVVLAVFIPLLVLFLIPRVRPLTIRTLLLTYVVPLLPILITWDGLASTLRTYRAEELRAMAEGIAREGYVWEVVEIPVPGAPVPVTRVLGMPTSP